MEKRTTTHDDWARLKTPSDPQISPDATRIAYVVKTTNLKKNRYESHIWVTETASGGPGRQWTNGGGDTPSEGSPRWSPDGQWLAFTSGRDDKKSQIWRISTQGGEAEKLTDLPQGGLGEFIWSPDGTRIAFTFRPQDEAWREDAVEQRKKDKKSSPGRVITRRHWREEGTGFVPSAPYHVHVFHVETGEVTQITPTGDDRNYGLECWSIDGSPACDLTPEWDVHCGNTAIGDVVGGGENGPFWASDSKSLLVGISESGSVNVYRVPLSEGASPEKLTNGPHVVAGFTVCEKAENATLLLATPTDGGDLYALNVAGGISEPRRLTELNEEFLAGLNLPAPIAFDAPSPEGHSVPCFVCLPPDFADDPTPRPALLYIHGGPHLMYAHTLFHEYQALAARGYVVVYPNPRGSKGYGEAWTAGIKGNWGEPAQSDCEACLDYAIAQGWADGDKLGVVGGSYGGYLTGWIAGHSDRFKAAIAERGVFNLVSMAGTCDFVWRDHEYFSSNTTNDTADYQRNSPLTYADQINTPMFIIHSEGDLRCPIEQAEQFFAALVMRNRDVTFLRYGPESNHNLSRGGPPDLRADRQERIAEFFARYLKGHE